MKRSGRSASARGESEARRARREPESPLRHLPDAVVSAALEHLDAFGAYRWSRIQALDRRLRGTVPHVTWKSMRVSSCAAFSSAQAYVVRLRAVARWIGAGLLTGVGEVTLSAPDVGQAHGAGGGAGDGTDADHRRLALLEEIAEATACVLGALASMPNPPRSVALEGYARHRWPDADEQRALGRERVTTPASALAGYLGALAPARGVALQLDYPGWSEVLAAAVVPRHPAELGGLRVGRIHPADAERIAGAWPALRSLDTVGTNGGAGLESLGRFEALEELHVRGMAANDLYTGVETLSPGIRRLSLWSSPLDAASAAALGARFPRLEELRVVAGEGGAWAETLASVAGLAGLRRLSLALKAPRSADRGAALVAAATAALTAAAPRLERLDLLLECTGPTGEGRGPGVADALVALARAARGVLRKVTAATDDPDALVALVRELDRPDARPPVASDLTLLFHEGDGADRIATLHALTQTQRLRTKFKAVMPEALRPVYDAIFRGWFASNPLYEFVKPM